MRLHSSIKPAILLAAAAALWMMPQTALAQTQTPYQFDNMCAPKSTFDTSLAVPHVHFVLDKSGSMGGTKWSLAVSAIKEIADSVRRTGTCNPPTDKTGCDEIFLGLSWFASGSGKVVDPADDTRDAIHNWLNSHYPGGGTNMGAAASEISGNAVLTNPMTIGIGAIVTDGVANTSSVGPARTNLCNARAGGTPTYAIGFGSGADPRMNSYFAAAGGTGECCSGSNCTYQPNEMIDPCAVSLSTMVTGNDLKGGYNCRGSLEASSGQALKSALLAIVNAAACTFPLSIPNDYPAGQGADVDPLATYVAINHATLGPGLELPFNDPNNPNALRDYLVNVRGIDAATANEYIGQGWTWADGTRQSVRLSPKLCNEISAGNVDVTETWVACLCENTDEACDVECNGGYNDGAACKDGFKAGRCKDGIIVCNFGVEECQQLRGRMPDICNGLDDNCDGMVDNVDSADPNEMSNPIKWQGQGNQPIPADKEGLFCGFIPNTCSCLNNQPDSPGMPPAMNQPEWGLLLDGHTGNCGCGAGLSPQEPLFTPDTSQDDAGAQQEAAEPNAASCAATPTGQAPTSLLMVVFALVGAALIRRRRQ